MSWLVLGDLHLQKYPRGVPASFSYLRSIFRQVEEYAFKNNVDTVVQVGDVHDGTGVEENTRAYFLDQIHHSKLKWKFLMGNHDYSDVNYNTLMYYKRLQKSLGILPNAEFFDSPQYGELKGKKVAYLPWPHNTLRSREPHVCFAHFAVAGAKGDNGYTIKSDTKISPHHYWEIGDLHTPQKGSNYNYIGAPLQFTFADSKERFFGHFTGNVDKPNTKRIPIQVPYQLEQVSCSDPRKIEKLKSYLDNRSENLFTQVKLGEQVLLDHRYEELSRIPRIDIKFAGKLKEETVQENVVLIDSKSMRENLVRNRLKSKGYSKYDIDKAIQLVNFLEEEK